jgi:dolichol-phosphate mannosyltransferase
VSTSRPLFSIVSPVYQAQEMVDELVRRIQASMETITADYEIILVDDRSPDDSWAGIQLQCARDGRVRGLRLSRNFGQHRAITAGLAHCRGEWMVVLDCDLQDRPEDIPALYAHAQQGNYDLVLARRMGRQHSWLKRLGSRWFYGLLSYLTDTPQDAAIANFGLYHRRVMEAVLALGDTVRYLPTMVRWVGFRAATLEVQHARRRAGRSSYSLTHMTNLALDVILTSSDKPMRLAVKTGLLMAGIALLLVPVALWGHFSGHGWELGYAGLLLSVWFLAGLLLATMGVAGLYVGKTFEQVKNRPLYFIDAYAGSSPAEDGASDI